MKIHPDTLQFFAELQENNNREWFAANKTRWTDIHREFQDFTQGLIDAMASYDPAVENLQAKRCIYRIYRDIRFSNDKTPFKTHIACFLPYGGDRTQCVPGYYLQLGEGYELEGCTLGGGFFMPNPKQLAAIRQEIFYCTDEFKAIIGNKDYQRYFGNEFWTTKKLSRPPKGYSADWPDIDLLKYHDYATVHNIPREMILSDQLFDEVIKVWRATLPLNKFLQRAIAE